MRKILFVLVLLFGHLYALEQDSTVKLYQQIFADMIHTKEPIKVYTEDKELSEILLHAKRIFLVNTPEKSDIAIVHNDTSYAKVIGSIKRTGKNVILFATNYRLLERYSDIVGALYWKKGRSQLLFIGERLKKHHLFLPEEYQSYIIDSL